MSTLTRREFITSSALAASALSIPFIHYRADASEAEFDQRRRNRNGTSIDPLLTATLCTARHHQAVCLQIANQQSRSLYRPTAGDGQNLSQQAKPIGIGVARRHNRADIVVGQNCIGAGAMTVRQSFQPFRPRLPVPD